MVAALVSRPQEQDGEHAEVKYDVAHYFPSMAHDLAMLPTCRSPEDLVRHFPAASIWKYIAHGDWGASYSQSMSIRLTKDLAMVVKESFDYDDHELSYALDVHGLFPESRSYIHLAAYRHDRTQEETADADAIPCRRGWEEAINPPLPFQVIPYSWIKQMNIMRLRYCLSSYAGLPFDEQDGYWEDETY